MKQILPGIAIAVFLLLASGAELGAQGGTTIPSLRPYWHVFIAYAAAWLLVFGWVVSIARRLARVERALTE